MVKEVKNYTIVLVCFMCLVCMLFISSGIYHKTDHPVMSDVFCALGWMAIGGQICYCIMVNKKVTTALDRQLAEKAIKQLDDKATQTYIEDVQAQRELNKARNNLETPEGEK